jgi:hypothetical protein
MSFWLTIAAPVISSSAESTAGILPEVQLLPFQCIQESSVNAQTSEDESAAVAVAPKLTLGFAAGPVNVTNRHLWPFHTSYLS